jgi:APA family basic amino acid/polyamine antiporter
MSTSPSPGKLKKILGVGFGIAIAVGGTIGVGILRTPGSVAALIPDYWLIMLCWIIGGIFMMVSAASYAELAVMLPKAGGAYNYAKRAFGNYTGFLVGWFDYIVNTIAPCYFCIVISEYMILLFPQLSEYKVLISISFLVFFTTINLPGVRNGSILQQVSSLVKVLIFVILIAACFIYGNNTGIDQHAKPGISAPGGAGLLISFFLALQLIMGSYDGWWSIAFFAEEDENPGKNIPRSLFTGTAIIMLVYLLTNAALLYVVPVSQASGSTLVASNAAEQIFGRSGSVIITIFALLSLVSILNAYIMIPSRIIYGLSRDGFFFSRFTYINKGGTPVFALLFSSFLQSVIIIISSFEQLFELGAYLSLIVFTISLLSLIRLRIKEPGLERPYRAWGYPYSTIISVIALTGMLVGFTIGNYRSLLVVLAVVAVSVPGYWVAAKSKGQR